MASSYSPLKIELIGTGDQNGTWGATTNINFNTAFQEAITGTVDVAFTSADVTLTLSNTNGSLTARNLRLNLTGTSGGARNLFIPALASPDAFTFVKMYIIKNNLADTVTVAVVGTPGTTVAIPTGKSLLVYSDGTNVSEVITSSSAVAYPGAGIANSTGTAWGTSYTTSGTGTVVALATSASLTTPTINTAASVGGTWTAASTWTLPAHIVAGDLTLSGGGYNFVGDFSNATVASRNAFETSTVNGNTVVGALPNGTGTGSAWQAYNATDPSNAGLATLEVSSTAVTLGASIRGSGTYLPMVFSTNGSTQMTLSTAGNLGLGNTPSGSFKLEVTGKVYSSGGYNVRVSSATSASTLTPNIDNFDMYAYTALAAGITISTPTGTPANGQKLMFRFKDNGTAQTISWSGLWPTQIGVTLPTTTVANKITYVGMIYNGGTSGWDAVAVTTQA
jgi:hypothetical protein